MSIDEDELRLARWLKVVLVTVVTLSIMLGLYALAGSAFLRTFGPGNQMMKWTPDHFVVFATAICSVVIGAGSALSLFLSSVRPLVGAIILSAIVVTAFFLNSI